MVGRGVIALGDGKTTALLHGRGAWGSPRGRVIVTVVSRYRIDRPTAGGRTGRQLQ